MTKIKQLAQNASDHADELTEVLGTIELQLQRENRALKQLRHSVAPNERADTLGRISNWEHTKGLVDSAIEYLNAIAELEE